MPTLRLAFMGTPDFAVPTLARLLDAGHDVVSAYAQPPRPKGRGHKPQPSPVHAFAEARGIPVRTPRTLRDAAEQAAFKDMALDCAVVVAYGLILPAPVLAAPRLGCLNVHASLLPRWRGAAPIQRAILAGDAETGISIMQMEAGLDTGPVYAKACVPIGPRDTAGILHDRLAELGADLLLGVLARLAADGPRPVAQDDALATYAAKIDPAEARIAWLETARALALKVRAFSPAPGAWFMAGERIKVLEAEAVDSHGGEPGRVLDDRLTVACGEGALRLVTVQRPGRKPMSALDVLRGFSLPAGSRLD